MRKTTIRKFSILFILGMFLFSGVSFADWYWNPFTGQYDYYEPPLVVGAIDHTLLLNIGVNSHAAIDIHIASTANPHSVTKTQVGLGNVENTALSTWAGTANITIVGTVVTGTWSADTIVVDKGGTGLVSYAIGDLLYASGVTTLSKLVDVAVGQVLVSGGVGVAPAWSATPTVTSLDTGQGANELYDMDQNVLQASDVTFNDIQADGTLLLAKGSQDYLFTDNGDELAIQGQSSSTDSEYSLFSKDGDATDDVRLHIFGLGTPGSIVNRERLTISWETNTSAYEIYTEAQNAGTLRPLVLYTEGNTNQLYLGIAGNSTFSGNLSRKYTVTTDNTDGVDTYSAAEMFGGLIRRGTGDQITSNRIDVTDTAANIVAAIPGAVVGSSFILYINNEDSTHTIQLDGGAGVTISPNDPSTAIPANSTGTFLVECTNVTAASEAVTVHALGVTVH